LLKPNINKATELGALAFKNGLKSVPAFDPELMKMIAGRQIGDKRTVPEMKAWQSGWHKANAANLG
jgi:hypothetical protein